MVIKKINIRELLYYLIIKLPCIIVGKIKGNLIYTHWGRGLNNFGDCLSVDILKFYGFTPVYSQQIDSDIILAGTILQWVPKHYKGIILGAGADNVKLEFPNAQILGVRGYLTLKNLNILAENVVLGDPGLIMNLVYPQPIKFQFELGIVPHFVDKSHPIIKKWKDRFGGKCVIIDVQNRPKTVIDQIKRCKAIVSSSLHGLVIADSFNIPNVRFVIRDTMPTYFYDYKFDDYYSALNCRPVLIEAKGNETLEYILLKMNIHTDQVYQLQNKLDSAFKYIRLCLAK